MSGSLRFAAHAAAVVVMIGAVPSVRAEEHGKRRGVQLFYRMVGADSNAPILPKTESIWTQDRQTRTGSTGMADEGYTEYPFCFGVMDFTFAEAYAIYPRLISGAQADERIVNTADMVIDHVYEPDGCVWGLTGRSFVQTFTAMHPELVSITLLVASEPGAFRAALLEGGAGGRQIGPARSFRSGHSMTWGSARWPAGQAPLRHGSTYGIRIWREDGQPFTPYLHATGNAYDGGMVYVDGVPRPESDLALWIVEEPIDLRRSPVRGADLDGWVYDQPSITFVPRTPNVRLITLTVSPIAEKCLDLVARVRSDDGRIVAGPERCISCGPVNGEHTAHFLFAADEFPVTPGQPYHVEAYTMPHQQKELPGDEGVEIIPRDMRMRVYGEPQPGALPAIFNLDAGYTEESKLALSWSVNGPCRTRLEIQGPGMEHGKRIALDLGQTSAVVPVWPGHWYNFRLIAIGSTGMTWRTPLYRVRMPRGTEIEPIMEAAPPYPRQFVPLAPPRLSVAPEYDPLRYREAVELVNADFEDEPALAGWTAAGDDVLGAPDAGIGGTSPVKKHGIDTKWGRRIAGFTHVAGEQREQRFAKSTLTQQIATTPGHEYLLAGMVLTDVADNGPRGDTRVRLFADPTGGDDFAGLNSSQWYWTDGRWMRFEHRWVAQGERATIGFGFFRWRDLDFAGAYVDHVHVYDLGRSAAAAVDPPPAGPTLPVLVLAEPKIEAADRVEAHLAAPPGYVVTGLGARAHYDNIMTLWMRVRPLQPDGTLGEPEELRAGWEPDAGLEARIELPAGYVATGFGAGIAPEWDVKRMGVWARPLNADGTLGEEKLFRGGVDRESGFEREVKLEPGRLLIAAGLNCMHNDVNGIRATSAVLTRTATAGAKTE